MPTTDRVVEPTGQFRRDWKRENKGRYHVRLRTDFEAVLAMLRADAELPPQYRDHQLGSQWQDCRDLHLRPDLILTYSTPDAGTLRLIRLGSHSELGL
ncbi:MAG: type II toxin-antitoxin system YafQ family toxin [Propionibacteriaceae bacterium]|nr:type II toxin-antitoxin system YafQ family toxin [Propionibacteriaceae bacterium]